VLVVDRDPGRIGTPAPAFGLSEKLYENERGQITKAEVRAISLSKLQPWRRSVVWDVGAGSGSVSIEVAGLMPRGTVYAVEDAAAQLAVLRRNLGRHPRENVRVVEGTAPAALAGLEPPDAVFVGGAGRELHGVMCAASAAIQPGGGLVANFAQLESLALWQAVAARTGWPAEVVQVSIARGASIGDGTRLAALNPVFVCTLERPEEPSL
jgi:precorrin-6Y C5,15-methyltransferase (decarboxylating)